MLCWNTWNTPPKNICQVTQSFVMGPIHGAILTDCLQGETQTSNWRIAYSLRLPYVTLHDTTNDTQIHTNTTYYYILSKSIKYFLAGNHRPLMATLSHSISTFRRRSARNRFPCDPASFSSAFGRSPWSPLATSSTKSSKLSMSTWNHGAPAWHGSEHSPTLVSYEHKVTGPWWKMELAFNIK